MPDQPARDAVRAALRRSGLLAAEQYVAMIDTATTTPGGAMSTTTPSQHAQTALFEGFHIASAEVGLSGSFSLSLYDERTRSLAEALRLGKEVRLALVDEDGNAVEVEAYVASVKHGAKPADTLVADRTVTVRATGAVLPPEPNDEDAVDMRLLHVERLPA